MNIPLIFKLSYEQIRENKCKKIQNGVKDSSAKVFF